MGIVFDGISKVFPDGTAALHGLDLEFDTGEFIVLLGPSGSGKTTACRVLAGLEQPTGGRILVDGKDVTDLPPRFRGMGMVFQNYALYSHKSVYENIAYPLRVRKITSRRDRQQRPEYGRPAADRPLSRPQAEPAFGRPGAARCGRPRAGLAARHLPDG